MFLLEQNPGRTAIVNKKEFLFFSGYSYLGMGSSPEFVALLHQGIDKYGVLFPSSRISNTALDLYTQTEKKLSALTNLADTVLMSSGFTAGKAAIEIIDKTVAIYQSPFCHPAIRVQELSGLSYSNWVTGTVDTINQDQDSNTAIILTDSVNPLTAEIYDFSFLNKIDKKIICIIDDSHGIGLIGKEGSGISSELPQKSNIEYIISYSLSKAMHIQAGAISCTNKETADEIRKTFWYTAVTPPAPAPLFAFNNASLLYQKQRSNLYSNLDKMEAIFHQKKGILFHKSLPILILPEELDGDYFFKKSILISSFAYPNPTGKKINRVVINAAHTMEDLELLASLI